MDNKPETLDYISTPFKIIVTILSLVLAIVIALSIALYWPHIIVSMIVFWGIFMVVSTFFRLLQVIFYLVPLAFKSVRDGRTVNEVLNAMVEEK